MSNQHDSVAAADTDHFDALVANLRQRHIRGLDGLRAGAALAVVLSHAGLPFPSHEAVSTFFVLSGLLITWLLLLEEERTGTVSLRAFFLRRSLRIFPAFWAYCLVGTVAMRVLHWPQSTESILANVFYLSNWHAAMGHNEPGVFGHTWSLAIEEQFYLLWPPLFLLLGRHPWVRLGGLLLAICAINVNRLWNYWPWEPTAWLTFATHHRADALLVGCAAAVALHQGVGRRLLGGMVCRPWLVLVLVVVLANLSGTLGRLTGLPYTYLLVAVCPFVALGALLGIVRWSGSRGFGWLEHRWVRWLGALSYSLYLWHQAPTGFVRRRLAELPPAVGIAVALSVSLALAVGSYYVVERPMLRWKDRLSGRSNDADQDSAKSPRSA